jgi:hypothetical protein
MHRCMHRTRIPGTRDMRVSLNHADCTQPSAVERRIRDSNEPANRVFHRPGAARGPAPSEPVRTPRVVISLRGLPDQKVSGARVASMRLARLD